MIVGIGTDIVQVKRMQDLLDKHGEVFAQKILNEQEVPGFHMAVHPAAFLAKRFAAKEATAKAFGTGFRDGLSLKHIWVGHNEQGRPRLNFEQRAIEIANELRIGASFLSVSDELDYAIAYVVLEQAL